MLINTKYIGGKLGEVIYESKNRTLSEILEYIKACGDTNNASNRQCYDNEWFEDRIIELSEYIKLCREDELVYDYGHEHSKR